MTRLTPGWDFLPRQQACTCLPTTTPTPVPQCEDEHSMNQRHCLNDNDAGFGSCPGRSLSSALWRHTTGHQLALKLSRAAAGRHFGCACASCPHSTPGGVVPGQVAAAPGIWLRVERSTRFVPDKGTHTTLRAGLENPLEHRT